MSTASITPLGPADRERWADLWTAYLTFYGTTLPDATYTSTWSRILDPHGDIRAFGARDRDGRLAGITHYFYHPHAWSAREVCYLQDLFVDPAARRRGHARALIEAVAEAARARSCFRVYWQTLVDNATARRLYDDIAVNSGSIVYEYSLA